MVAVLFYFAGFVALTILTIAITNDRHYRSDTVYVAAGVLTLVSLSLGALIHIKKYEGSWDALVIAIVLTVLGAFIGCIPRIFNRV